MTAHARYEVRVSGQMSERARSAFGAMDVRVAPPQTIMLGELAEGSDLRELLALCSAMGFEVVSLQRLPAPAGHRSPAGDEAAARAGGDAGRRCAGAGPVTAPRRDGEGES